MSDWEELITGGDRFIEETTESIASLAGLKITGRVIMTTSGKTSCATVILPVPVFFAQRTVQKTRSPDSPSGAFYISQHPGAS